jgi:plasmid maintenance system antidote protein VapI
MEEPIIENEVASFLKAHPGVKIQELAEAIGVSRAWIYLLAKGERNVPKWMPVVLNDYAERTKLRGRRRRQ